MVLFVAVPVTVGMIVHMLVGMGVGSAVGMGMLVAVLMGMDVAVGPVVGMHVLGPAQVGVRGVMVMVVVTVMAVGNVVLMHIFVVMFVIHKSASFPNNKFVCRILKIIQHGGAFVKAALMCKVKTRKARLYVRGYECFFCRNPVSPTPGFQSEICTFLTCGSCLAIA
jgi:hypothetical protein